MTDKLGHRYDQVLCEVDRRTAAVITLQRKSQQNVEMTLIVICMSIPQIRQSLSVYYSQSLIGIYAGKIKEKEEEKSTVAINRLLFSCACIMWISVITWFFSFQQDIIIYWKFYPSNFNCR